MKYDIFVEECDISPDPIPMNKSQEAKLKKLGIFTLTQANELGISQQSLSKLIKQTIIKKIGLMAKELGLDSYLNKYFEAIIGAIEG